jgi:hypothetical protein
MEKTKSGHWPVGIGELKASKDDAAIGGHAKSKSDVGAGSHRFLLDKESARLPPTWGANCWCFIN